MQVQVELRYDATRGEIRFAPLSEGRYILCTPNGDVSFSLYISEAQALSLYRLLRLYLRNPLTRWGPEAAEAEERTSRAQAGGR